MSCRLSKSISPSHYLISYGSISLTPPFEFTGVVSITLRLANDVDQNSITLHCLDLAIEQASLIDGDGGSDGMEATSINYSIKNETVTLVFPSKINSEKGNVKTLKVVFNGKLNDKMRGLYRSSYVGLDGKEKVMCCTQFESTDARRAFPCWDEPAFKATFKIIATVPLLPDSNIVAVSNTPVQETNEFRLTGKRFKTVRICTTRLRLAFIGS